MVNGLISLTEYLSTLYSYDDNCVVKHASYNKCTNTTLALTLTEGLKTTIESATGNLPG